jgi:Na+/serine symporter
VPFSHKVSYRTKQSIRQLYQLYLRVTYLSATSPTSIALIAPCNSLRILSPTSGQVAVPQRSAERFRSLSVELIRNPNRRRSIDSKYALDARAVSRLSFELWTSKPRIRTS